MKLEYKDILSGTTIDMVREFEKRLLPTWPEAARDEFHQRLQGLWEHFDDVSNVVEIESDHGNIEMPVSFRYSVLGDSPAESPFYFVVRISVDNFIGQPHEAVTPEVTHATATRSKAFVSILQEMEEVFRATSQAPLHRTVRFASEFFRYLEGQQYHWIVVQTKVPDAADPSSFGFRYVFNTPYNLTFSVILQGG